MAHPIQQLFCERVKKTFPVFFNNIRVIDIGSLDINGNNKCLFSNCDYIGLDIVEGKNVDVVSVAHEYECPDCSFDVVVSTNALEHDIHRKKTLKKMYDLVRSGGLIFFSAAHKWKEHGTINTSPSQSATSEMDKEWAEYYKNLNPEDITEVWDLDKLFSTYELEVENKDLQFWGVKR